MVATMMMSENDDDDTRMKLSYVLVPVFGRVGQLSRSDLPQDDGKTVRARRG
jgi:hypothetical protein